MIHRMYEEKLEEMEKKTIKVNGEIWEEDQRSGTNVNYLMFEGKQYRPQKKELTLEQIRNNGLSIYNTLAPIGRGEKLDAIRDMIIVADYVNQEHDDSDKFEWHEIYINPKGEVDYLRRAETIMSFTSFHPDEVERAIKILGEDTIKLALS